MPLVVLLLVLVLLLPLVVGVVTKLDVTLTVTSVGTTKDKYPQNAATCTRKTDVGESMSKSDNGPMEAAVCSESVRA